MDPKTGDVLNGVTQKTNSELILFFVIMAVLAIALIIPLYRFALANAREKRKAAAEAAAQAREAAAAMAKQQSEERAQLIAVISHNSDVNTQLKVMLETNNNVCSQCRVDHQTGIIGLGDKLDEHNDKLVEIYTLLKTKPCLAMAKGATQ